MEKVFKILIVFALLMFLIVYTFRSRDRRFREYVFSYRRPDTPPDGDEPELFSSIISHEGVAMVTDEETGLIYSYNITGVLTIFRQSSLKELQRLNVPANGYYLSIDPIKDELHLHHEGEIYIYTRKPAGA